MIIKKLIIKKKKVNFILENKKNLKIIDLIKTINKNKLGFIILKQDNYKIITDGDIRRYICKHSNLKKLIKNEKIGSSKIISIDINKSIYDASRLILNKKVNTLIITSNSKIVSYIQKDEILKFLSPERITIEKSKIEKYQVDLEKHFLRYNFASFFSKKNFNVLDAACGTGYGSYILSKNSKKVISIDKSSSAIDYAKINFNRKNIFFAKNDINKLKYKNKFELIVSIETLEHLDKKNAILWLKNCKKMLKKNGIFICSSPLLRIKNNKPIITNPHHLHEMKKNEFIQNLKKIFRPKIFISYIQDGYSMKPLTNEKNGLCFTYIKT